MTKTIFKRIIDKEIPTKLVHEDELCIAFRDINPQAPVHILVIPKEEIESLADLKPEHQALVGHLHLVIAQLARQENLVDGYRVVVNCGSDGGQTVPHLHYHLLGGRALAWPPG